MSSQAQGSAFGNQLESALGQTVEVQVSVSAADVKGALDDPKDGPLRAPEQPTTGARVVAALLLCGRDRELDARQMDHVAGPQLRFLAHIAVADPRLAAPEQEQPGHLTIDVDQGLLARRPRVLDDDVALR